MAPIQGTMHLIARPLLTAGRTVLPKATRPVACRAPFSTTPKRRAQNQIFDAVRNADQFYTYQLLSSSARTPLLTLWTASWCPTCRTVGPLLHDLITSGTGEAEGGVAFCEVVYDAPDIVSANLGLTYGITALPTLLSFDAQEAQVETKIMDGRQLADRNLLIEWICHEARRHGQRGGGGGGVGGLFGGLFGKGN